MTAEAKKGKYIYYHCTGYKGKCGNTYVAEERLSELMGEIVRKIQIDANVADKIAVALRESHEDKKKFHGEAIRRLPAQYDAIQARIEKAYDDKLEGKITEDFWNLKSKKWQSELADIHAAMTCHEHADSAYIDQGLKILELAKRAHSLYLRQNHHERRKLLNAVLSNCAFDRGSLCPTYISRLTYSRRE